MVFILQVIGQIVLFLHVDVESMRDLVQIVLSYAADETVVLQLVFHTLHLVAKGAKGVNDETCKQGKAFSLTI